MDNTFPDRKDIKKSYQSAILDTIREIDVEKVDFTVGNFKPRSEIVEKQKVYFWIRLYIKEEVDMKPDTVVKILYTTSGEFLETKFICYSKKGLDKDLDNEIVGYNTEDDKKVLCLMVDSDKINYDNKDIPFIKTLFKTSRFYEYQLLKRDELVFINSDGTKLDYYDVNF